MLEDHIVMNSYITRGLICHMHVMTLLDKTDEGSSHGYDVIIRMRREYEDALRERIRRYRSCRIIGIRFSSRPSRNGVLKIIEHIYIDPVIRTELLEEFA